MPAVSTTALLFFLVSIHMVVCEEPEAHAMDMVRTGNVNTPLRVRLAANVPIPDNGELNWNIPVQDNFTVTDVSVRLRGLFHHTAGDLVATLLHDDGAATFLRNEGGHKGFGLVRNPRVFESTGPFTGHTPIQGEGADFEWRDIVRHNIAINGSAAQQSTVLGGEAGRAIDGDTRGHYSAGTVTHTDNARLAGGSPHESWWEVDFGSVHPVGAIRVWNREQEVNVDEVQEVRVSAATVVKGGSFRLSVTVRNETAVTQPISVFAVPLASDEDHVSPAPPPGAGPGQSMESALQGIAFLPNVRVSLVGQSSKGERVWRITFESEPADIQPMTATNVNIDAVRPTVRVETLREGNNNPWYNYKGPLSALKERLFPYWVLLLPTSLNDTSLETAKAAAVWKRRVATPSRQNLLTLPPGRSGRCVRIQLEEQNYLTLAEVEVFSSRHPTIANYAGGSPILPGAYQSAESLVSAFHGAQSYGDWLLQLRDTEAAVVNNIDASFPRAIDHGMGGLSTWELVLTDAQGVEHEYSADVMMKIRALPVFGKLYSFNATMHTVGPAIPEDPNRLSYQLPCIDHDCSYRWEVGYAADGGSTPKGSHALTTNRLTWEANGYSVTYVPNDGWLGQDFFTYSVYVGTKESLEATVTLQTRRCRLGRCNNDAFNDLATEESH